MAFPERAKEPVLRVVSAVKPIVSLERPALSSNGPIRAFTKASVKINSLCFIFEFARPSNPIPQSISFGLVRLSLFRSYSFLAPARKLDDAPERGMLPY